MKALEGPSKKFLERKISVVKNCIAQRTELFAEYCASLLPLDRDQRQALSNVLWAKFASTSPPSDVALSAPADKVITLHPDIFNDEGEYAGHFIGEIFQFPVWTSDATITIDLVTAMHIMVDQINLLNNSSAAVAGKAPILLRNETSRAADADITVAPLISLSEGLLTIVQAVNMGLGQLITEYAIEEEEAVQQVVSSRIPTQTARYMPLGYVAATSQNWKYIKEGFVWDGEKFVINPKIKKHGRKVKRSLRNTRIDDHRSFHDIKTAEEYLQSEKHTPNAIRSGTLCPVGREHVEEELPAHSGIDILSEDLIRIFKIIRHLRKAGIIS